MPRRSPRGVGFQVVGFYLKEGFGGSWAERALRAASAAIHRGPSLARFGLSCRTGSYFCRHAEIAKHKELGALTNVKRVELLFAERFRREAQMANFIRTAAARPLLWLPAQHSAETLALLHEEQKRLDTWKVRAQGLGCSALGQGLRV